MKEGREGGREAGMNGGREGGRQEAWRKEGREGRVYVPFKTVHSEFSCFLHLGHLLKIEVSLMRVERSINLWGY